MKIKRITSMNRRDFTAEYVCEYCGHITVDDGYDDENFHQNVIPKMRCKSCGMGSTGEYIPLTPKYPDGYQV